ncbi:MAG: FG-GAP-like repeat-containing protein, partial [Pseudomonadota bacterium]
MNSWISTKRPLLLALSMLGMSTILPATQAQMMMVPGQFNVTPGGAATYSIPIEVPPGTAGMVPSLSLNYSSQGGNGILGVGWSLGGLPSISRCGKTIAQDGTTKGVEYSSDDRFCLEGQKLIAINGPYGGDGTEYRTEIDGFSKIVSYTNSGINGPAWFKVWTKSGQIMEFGNTADSQMKASSELSYVRVWAANKISDVMGNYLTVTYNTSQSTGESFPTRIDYTGNDGESLSPYNSVRFNYENRSDDSTRYLAGSKLSLTKRLKTIKTYAGSTIVKQYKLNYSQSSSTDRSLLKDIELCAGASGPCLPKTVFDFSQSTFGFGSALGGRFSNTILKSSAGYQIFPADWNGDGHADLLAFKPNGGNNQWYRGDGLGNFTPQSTLISLSHIANGELVFGDFNGDALPDIFWFNNSNNGANKLILNTSTNNLISFAAPIFNPITNVELTVPTSQNNGSELRAGDFNGDGLTDLFWYNSLFGLKNLFINTGTNNFTVYNNVVSVNFGVPDECDQAPPIFNCRARVSDYNVQVLDLNANGTSDLHVLREVTVTNDAGEPEFQGKNYESYFLLNDLSFSFDTFTENNDLTEEEEDYIRGRVRGVRRSQFSDDWNGDGVTDVRFVNSDRDTEIAINRGDASLQKPNIDFNGGVNRRFLSVDLDSNGLTDLLRYDTSSGQNTVYLNKDGLDFSSVASVITPSNINTDGNIYVADFNGDGLNDLLWVGENLGTNYIYLNQSTVPDLMTSVTTGLGSTTAFEYKIGTDSSVYTKDTGGNAATYPTVDLLAPMRLISKVEADDGIGGTYDSTYKYV